MGECEVGGEVVLFPVQLLLFVVDFQSNCFSRRAAPDPHQCMLSVLPCCR